MYRERKIKLLRRSGAQIVRIPREFHLPGEDVIIRKEGDRLVIEPKREGSLLAFLATLETLDEDIGPIEDWPPDPVNL